MIMIPILFRPGSSIVKFAPRNDGGSAMLHLIPAKVGIVG
jgi:hypothetical protein